MCLHKQEEGEEEEEEEDVPVRQVVFMLLG